MNKKISLLLYPLFLSLLLTSCFRNNTDNANLQKQQDQEYSFIKSKDRVNFNISSIDELYDFLTYDEHTVPLISAHRGGDMPDYPENAIETFSYWAEKFPLIIECDVQITKDSQLILMHDKTLNRTSNGSGRIKDKTLAEIKELRLKDQNDKITTFQIPTLKEALLWGKGKVIFTLDVKQDVPYALLSQIIKETEAESHVVLITYNSKQAYAAYRTNPDLMLSVSINSNKDLLDLTHSGIPDNRLVAFVGTSQPKTDLVNILHSHGIKIILGTMGNLDRQAKSRGYQVYAQFIENGADILSTDNPKDSQKALDYYIQKRKLSSPYINF